MLRDKSKKSIINRETTEESNTSKESIREQLNTLEKNLQLNTLEKNGAVVYDIYKEWLNLLIVNQKIITENESLAEKSQELYHRLRKLIAIRLQAELIKLSVRINPRDYFSKRLDYPEEVSLLSIHKCNRYIFDLTNIFFNTLNREDNLLSRKLTLELWVRIAYDSYTMTPKNLPVANAIISQIESHDIQALIKDIVLSKNAELMLAEMKGYGFAAIFETDRDKYIEKFSKDTDIIPDFHFIRAWAARLSNQRKDRQLVGDNESHPVHYELVQNVRNNIMKLRLRAPFNNKFGLFSEDFKQPKNDSTVLNIIKKDKINKKNKKNLTTIEKLMEKLLGGGKNIFLFLVLVL